MSRMHHFYGPDGKFLLAVGIKFVPPEGFINGDIIAFSTLDHADSGRYVIVESYRLERDTYHYCDHYEGEDFSR